MEITRLCTSLKMEPLPPPSKKRRHEEMSPEEKDRELGRKMKAFCGLPLENKLKMSFATYEWPPFYQIYAKQWVELAESVKTERQYCVIDPKHHPEHRYVRVLPFEDNQVVLKNGTQTNGSAITSLCNANKTEYIAMSAPTSIFRRQLLEMILEQSIGVVVKLANVDDAPYFPPQGERLRVDGKYTITHLAESSYFKGKFSVNKQFFSIRKTGESVVYTFLQLSINGPWSFRYTMSHIEWIELVNEIDEYMKRQDIQGPLIVHCDGGLSRTGTFIAAREIIHLFNENKFLDVNQVILSLRKQRAGMVQTLEQYFALQDIASYLEMASTQPDGSQ